MTWASRHNSSLNKNVHANGRSTGLWAAKRSQRERPVLGWVAGPGQGLCPLGWVDEPRLGCDRACLEPHTPVLGQRR